MQHFSGLNYNLTRVLLAVAEEAYFKAVRLVNCPKSPRVLCPASNIEGDGWRDSDGARPDDDE